MDGEIETDEERRMKRDRRRETDEGRQMGRQVEREGGDGDTERRRDGETGRDSGIDRGRRRESLENLTVRNRRDECTTLYRQRLLLDWCCGARGRRARARHNR